MTGADRYKITDLYETKMFTRTERNEWGQLEKVQKEMRIKRPVKELSTGLRIVNFLIDVSIFQALGIFFRSVDVIGSIPFSALIYSSLFPMYYMLSEYYFQRTIGKLITGSIVINEYGEKPDVRTMAVRTMTRLIIPFDAISFLNGGRGFHDKWSNTFVVKPDEVSKIRQLMTDPENLASD